MGIRQAKKMLMAELDTGDTEGRFVPAFGERGE